MASDSTPASKQWRLFAKRCLQRRIRADKFEALAKQLRQRTSIPGSSIAATLFRPRQDSVSFLTGDPLVPVYIERLMGAGLVDAADVLSAMFNSSRHRPPKGAEQSGADGEGAQAADSSAAEQEQQNSSPGGKVQNPPELEETIFYRVAKSFNTGERPKSIAEARRTSYMAIQWMTSIVASGTSDSMMDALTGGNQQMQLQSALVREALGMLMIAVMENEKMATVQDTAVPKSKMHFL